jgi:hypothetical protein
VGVVAMAVAMAAMRTTVLAVQVLVRTRCEALGLAMPGAHADAPDRAVVADGLRRPR